MTQLVDQQILLFDLALKRGNPGFQCAHCSAFFFQFCHTHTMRLGLGLRSVNMLLHFADRPLGVTLLGWLATTHTTAALPGPHAAAVQCGGRLQQRAGSAAHVRQLP